MTTVEVIRALLLFLLLTISPIAFNQCTVDNGLHVNDFLNKLQLAKSESDLILMENDLESISFEMGKCALVAEGYDIYREYYKSYMYLQLADRACQLRESRSLYYYLNKCDETLANNKKFKNANVSLPIVKIETKLFDLKIKRSDLEALFYRKQELYCFYHYMNEDYAQAIRAYNGIAGLPLSTTFSVDKTIAFAYYKMLKQQEDSYSTVISSLIKTTQLYVQDFQEWSNRDKEGFSKVKMEYDSLLTPPREQQFEAVDLYGVKSITIARLLHQINEEHLAKSFAYLSSVHGNWKKEDGFWYLDSLAGQEKSHVVAAIKIIEREYDLKSSEVKKVAAIAKEFDYAPFKETLKRVKREEKQKKLEKRPVAIIPSVELIGLPLGHVPFTLLFKTRRVIHEVRFDYAYGVKSKYHFGMLFEKKDDRKYFGFKGWDVGYGIIYKLREDTYFSFDLRYVDWTLDEIVSDVLNLSTGQVEKKVPIHGQTNRYELGFKFGIPIFRNNKYVWMDFYYGLGIGYRTLKTLEQFENPVELMDSRLQSSRWNRFYAPLRFGLRFGLRVW